MYTRKNMTTCGKFVINPSKSYDRNAFSKLSTSLKQLVRNLTEIPDLLQGYPKNSDTDQLQQDCHKAN